MCADPVMRYIGNGQPSRSESWKYGNDAALATAGLRYVGGRRAPCGVMIGRIGCWQPGWPGFEIGWTLRRAYWGRGFATVAARAAMNHVS